MRKFINTIFIFILAGTIPGIIFILPCFLVIPYQTGGFGGWGIPFGPYDTIFKNVDYCYVEHIGNIDSLQNVEILTIGDSFSQSINNGYQNYMGHKLNKKISNFRIKDSRPENTAYTILEEDLAPNCKVIIVESVERAFIWSLCNEFYKLKNIKEHVVITKNIKNFENYEKAEDKKIKLYDFDLQKLITFYRNKLSITSSAIELKLKQDMFTSDKYSKSLFIYNNNQDWDGDLLFQHLKDEQIKTAISNLEELYKAAEKKHIKLIYMIPADKYDLYYDWIEKNPYPPNSTLSHFMLFDSTKFVNTKNILLPYLKKGQKDVYRVNDSHWSVIGAQIVGEHLADIISKDFEKKQ